MNEQEGKQIIRIVTRKRQPVTFRERRREPGPKPMTLASDSIKLRGSWSHGTERGPGGDLIHLLIPHRRRRGLGRRTREEPRLEAAFLALASRWHSVTFAAACTPTAYAPTHSTRPPSSEPLTPLSKFLSCKRRVILLIRHKILHTSSHTAVTRTQPV